MKIVRENINEIKRATDDVFSGIGVGKMQLIKKWLEDNKITSYTINDDMSIDVQGTVYLYERNVSGKLPDYIKFGKIYGHFICPSCKLKSLKGFPHSVAGKFDCSYNLLRTLEGGPTDVNSYDCSGNELRSLKWIASTISLNLDCSGNKLESLKHSPEKIGGHIDCSNNKLKSLKHVPNSEGTGTGIDCSNNKLTSLKHSPIHMMGDFLSHNNKLDDLDYMPVEIGGKFSCFGNNKQFSLEYISTKSKIIGKTVN